MLSMSHLHRVINKFIAWNYRNTTHIIELMTFLFFPQDYVAKFVDNKCQFGVTSLNAQNTHF